MVRYLSSAWFDRLREHAETFVAPGPNLPAAAPVPARPADEEPLVLRHVLRGDNGPEQTDGGGDYDVVIAGGGATIRHPTSGRADLTFTTDYPTAAAIAAGRLSTHAALAEGRLQVAGDVGIVARRSADVAGLDPVPAALRAETEF
jgi:hypothetical protein